MKDKKTVLWRVYELLCGIIGGISQDLVKDPEDFMWGILGSCKDPEELVENLEDLVKNPGGLVRNAGDLVRNPGDLVRNAC